MNTMCRILTILICIAATQITRWVPFLFFSGKKEVPAYIRYLGNVLPVAVFGMLIVYCLKNVSFLHGSHGIPELTGIAVTVLLHLWKKNMFLSIFAGTSCYMILLRI